MTELGEAVRLEVHDRTRVPPVMARQSADAMTGRGLRLVASLSTTWGAEPTDDGKVVWAELSSNHPSSPFAPKDLLDLWDDAQWADPRAHAARHRVSLGDVPTSLLRPPRPTWTTWSANSPLRPGVRRAT